MLTKKEVRGITLKDLGKKSLSRNNLLFGLMQRMDLVEKIGSGILRMKKAMKEYGLQNPKIETNENWFSIIFKRKTLEAVQERVLKESGGVIEKTTQKTTQKILELLIKNPQISRKEISENLENITEDGIKYNLAKLKKDGRIERVGPDKGGHWKIIKK